MGWDAVGYGGQEQCHGGEDRNQAGICLCGSAEGALFRRRKVEVTARDVHAVSLGISLIMIGTFQQIVFQCERLWKNFAVQLSE